MTRNRSYWIGFFSLLLVVGGIYFGTQVYTIYGGDAGDLVSAIETYGVAHPPGYPFYTILGIGADKLIPGGTVAWRIAFLSSIPAILTVLILFDLLCFLTKRLFISLISVLVLAFTYPFWLYSVVVEVFSLNNLLTVIILWTCLRFLKEAKKIYLYLLAFTFGLGVSHHHIILFLAPLLFLILFQKRKLLTRKTVFTSIALFFAGLTPYLYVFASASSNPAVNWLGEATLSNFWQLVTRATYGTFKAGNFIVNEPFLRLWGLYGFWDFAYKDFRILGVLLFFLGFLQLLWREKKIFVILMTGLISYLFFLFYASFPLSDNFIVGTFERFVLPIYIFIIFFIAFGLLNFIYFIENQLTNLLAKSKRGIIFSLVPICLFIYPVGLFIINFPKISILKNDFTAEDFGRDIVNSVPNNSIILIAVDTPLFDSQYVYFTEKKRQSVKLIHFSKLFREDNKAYFKRYYPDMILPDFNKSPKEQLETFLEGNYHKFPIFSKQAYVSEGGVWIPWGLLFRYYQNEDIPADSQILDENEKLWSLYHDPLSGSLSKYKNLLLSDVLKFYSVAHQEIAFWQAKKGFDEKAEKHLLTAEKLAPADMDSYSILAQVYIRQNKCDAAAAQIEHRLSLDKEDAANYLLSALNHSLCYKDFTKASQLQAIYEQKLKQKETPLRKL